MGTSQRRVLLVADHPGPSVELVERWGKRGEVVVLRLPWWEDSSLSRAVRLHALPAAEREAVADWGERLLEAVHEALRAQSVREADWQYLRQVIEAHAVTPLVEAAALVRRAVKDVRPEILVAVVNVWSRDWWAGKHMAEAAVREVAAEEKVAARIEYVPRIAGAVVRGMGPQCRAWMRTRGFVRRAMRTLQDFERVLATQRGGARRAEVLFLCQGPVVERLARRVACEIEGRGGTCLVALDPLAPRQSGSEGALLLGRRNTRGSIAMAREMVLRGPAWARGVMRRLSGHLSPIEAMVLSTRMVGVGCRERPLVSLMRGDAARLLDVVRPRVLVAFNFLPRLLTPYLVAARERGVATVCCQHGLISALDYPSPWFDWFLVFNMYTAELVRGRIPPHAEIRVVGNPTLDGLAGRMPDPLRPEAAGEMPVVLVATQPNDPPMEARGGHGNRARAVVDGVPRRGQSDGCGRERYEDWWFMAVVTSCAELGAYVAVKLHPQQRDQREGEMYRRALDEAGARGEVIPHGKAELSRLIAGCDVFVSQFSSTLLEAIALRKPTVFVELREGPPFYPFDEYGVARRATTVFEVQEALRAALTGSGKHACAGVATSEDDTSATADSEAYERFAARHLEPFDGQSVVRIAELIAEAGGM